MASESIAIMGGGLYASDAAAAARLERLENRTPSYRFDLEAAPCWGRIDEPGHHASAALLGDLGVDVGHLGDHFSTFDWIFAATVCRSFVALEEWIVEFARRESDRLFPSKSLDALVEEELKHIRLFQRYEERLLARHDRAAFERAYEPMGERIKKRGARLFELRDAADRHYLLWANTLFFEEFTVYLDERLQAEAEHVQPTWLSIHRLHRIEEMQHLATDGAYIEALRLDDARKRELSVGFVLGILQNFNDTVALSAAVSHEKAIGRDRVCPEGGISGRPFFRHLLEWPAFKHTRRAAPYLVELASEKS